MAGDLPDAASAFDRHTTIRCPPMASHILLTGTPACGKTTLVRRIVEQLGDLRLAGFLTEEWRGQDDRRVGFRAIGLNGGSVMLASVKSQSSTRVGKYGVELTGFEELIRGELERSDADVDLFVVDEVGRMECFSRLFVEQMQKHFDGPTPLLATIAIKGGGFIDLLKERGDVELIVVTPKNRDELADQLVERLRRIIAIAG